MSSFLFLGLIWIPVTWKIRSIKRKRNNQSYFNNKIKQIKFVINIFRIFVRRIMSNKISR